jgi:hypothetical protein
VNTLRFRIPKVVSIALQLGGIKRRARRALVTDVRFECDEKAGPGEHRIKCSMAMAIYFVEELRQLETRAKAQRDNVLVAECARAKTTAFKAIDGDRAPAVVTPSPVTHSG